MTAFIERDHQGRSAARNRICSRPPTQHSPRPTPRVRSSSMPRCSRRTAATSPALAGPCAQPMCVTGAIEQAKQTLALVPEAKRNDGAVAAARAALEVAEQAQSVGPIGELEQKVAANPLDHQARFDLAVALNGKGRRAGGGRRICSRSSSATANGTMTARASSSFSSSRPGARPTRRPSPAAGGCRRSCSREAYRRTAAPGPEAVAAQGPPAGAGRDTPRAGSGSYTPARWRRECDDADECGLSRARATSPT